MNSTASRPTTPNSTYVGTTVGTTLIPPPPPQPPPAPTPPRPHPPQVANAGLTSQLKWYKERHDKSLERNASAAEIAAENTKLSEELAAAQLKTEETAMREAALLARAEAAEAIAQEKMIQPTRLMGKGTGKGQAYTPDFDRTAKAMLATGPLWAIHHTPHTCPQTPPRLCRCVCALYQELHAHLCELPLP